MLPGINKAREWVQGRKSVSIVTVHNDTESDAFLSLDEAFSDLLCQLDVEGDEAIGLRAYHFTVLVDHVTGESLVCDLKEDAQADALRGHSDAREYRRDVDFTYRTSVR